MNLQRAQRSLLLGLKDLSNPGIDIMGPRPVDPRESTGNTMNCNFSVPSGHCYLGGGYCRSLARLMKSQIFHGLASVNMKPCHLKMTF